MKVAHIEKYVCITIASQQESCKQYRENTIQKKIVLL